MLSNGKQTELDQAILASKSLVKYLVVISCVVNLLNLASPLYTMQVYDRVLSSGSTHTLIMLAIVVTIALTLLALIQLGRSFLVASVGLWLERKLSRTVFNHAMAYALLAKNYMCGQALRDLKTIKSYISGRSMITILDIPWSVIFIAALFMLHPYLGFLSIFSCLAMIGFAFISDKLTQSLLVQHNETFIKSMQDVEQSTRDVELSSTMGIQGNIVENWEALNHQSYITEKTLVQKRATISEVIKYFRMLLQVTIISLCAYLVLKHELSSGAIIASSVLFGRAIAPFEQMIASWKEWINCKKAYQRLTQILRQTFFSSHPASVPDLFEGELEAENIHFVFPGDKKYALRGVQFKLEPGEILMVMGQTASGKSILGKLLMGVWQPNIGSIKLDGSNLSHWTKEDVAKHIGYLPQHITLFNGTIMENIARMDKGAEDKKVIEAAKLLGVHELILKLPNGYHTLVGSNGAFLAEGQKQLVALARAFYNFPSLLVLDEPSLYLDYYGEILLKQSLEKVKQKKMTTIIISNHRDLIESADKVLILQDGMVKLFGPKEEVLQRAKEVMRKASHNSNAE